ncbi:MAG: tRNA pseudouridine(38-40) synthase TruA [Armatimonadetes bacterium]|nr:tRNA pseudouridine(38-40) synthase TruA [Armatimonadota bacterium]MBS1710764.1 tRNA pseudouridine(38-40) synthase TruA [Armatimonadota bacterium]
MRPKPPSSNLSIKRTKLTVAYDGTDFCGWAPQHGLRSVHGTLKDGLCQVTGKEVELYGASRTDSGAHARGQVCHFDPPVPIPVDRWVGALSRVLPRDLSILKAEEVAPDFDSRFMARKRHYRYRILTGPRDPHRMRFAHWHWTVLDAPQMHRAAQLLVGEHDFLAFSQELEGTENTVRTLFHLQVRQVRDEVWLDVQGTAFVRGMMRRIAGCLLEIGRGKREPDWIGNLLTATDKSSIDWPPVLPACGLTLMRVSYGRHPKDHRFE